MVVGMTDRTRNAPSMVSKKIGRWREAARVWSGNDEDWEGALSGRACFGCAPGHEGLAAELAGLVNGSWVLTPGVHDVMIMADGATVPQELPGPASQEALAWWHRSVSPTLAPTRRRS